MTPADTPDIVDLLMEAAKKWAVADLATDPDKIDMLSFRHRVADILRAAQSPQARDEGGAVEGWVMVPREPTDQMLDACTAAPAPPVPHPDQGWLPIVLCPTDGVWHLVKLPDGAEVVASFEGRELGPHVRQWRVKEFGYHNPARPIGEVGSVKQMSAPYDTFVIKSLPEGVYPTHFRPNDTVYGLPSPPTDAINTAEGEAWLAQRGETATGLMRREPPHNPLPMPKYEFQAPDTSGGSTLASPSQAPQDVAGLVAEARDWAKYFRHEPSVVVNVHDARFSELLDRLAAALTPRELTGD